MTFIASVVAKNGVALIADSLVTTVERVLNFSTFVKYLQSKSTPIAEIKIEPSELVRLFGKKKSHTKDFEEKLFMYDKYTSVMTAGAAAINQKKIEYLIKEMVAKNRKDKSYKFKKMEAKIKDFCAFLNKTALEHFQTYDEIFDTSFIFTHYDRNKEKVTTYKVNVNGCNKKSVVIDSAFNCTSFMLMDDYLKVVCDGQNRISERILFGEIEFLVDIAPKIVKKVITDLNIRPNKIPVGYVENFLADSRSLLSRQFFDDMKVQKLADLSLQQAVELASLLMKIEMNFQKYTENIPTVGGVIKLAVIDENGFRFISGKDIIKPENIH